MLGQSRIHGKVRKEAAMTKESVVRRMEGRRDEGTGLVSFQREMNRLFDDFFRGFGLDRPWGVQETNLSAFTPRVNVSETDKEVRVSAELPGMDEKDVKVELDDASLAIHGEKKEEHEEKHRHWHRVEHTFGSFYRVVPFPAKVDGGKAKAKFQKGVLTVTLPKVEDEGSRRRVIEIET
jgi:HSP20 family protein